MALPAAKKDVRSKANEEYGGRQRTQYDALDALTQTESMACRFHAYSQGLS